MFGRLSSAVQALVEEGERYDSLAMADNTLKTYATMWNAFQRWCDSNEVCALPADPQILAVYVTELARRLKAASIGVHLGAIRFHHKQAGHPPPTEDAFLQRRMRGIRRKKGMIRTKKAPLVLDDLDRLLDMLGTSKRDIRNKAMFMLAWAAGLRRSEAVGLDCGPNEGGTGFVRFTAQGLEIVLTRSKTDQEGEGRVIAVPLRSRAARCPVRLLRAWISASGIETGPLFRPIDCFGKIGASRLAPVSLCRAVKTAAKRLGYDGTTFGGHSLRAGFVTSTISAGASVSAVQETTGHRQVETLFGYVRQIRRYSDSPLKQIPSW